MTLGRLLLLGKSLSGGMVRGEEENDSPKSLYG